MTPIYSIKGYTEQIYKVTEFKGSRDPDHVRLVAPSEDWEVNETKLSQSISRARSMVLQYALCNQWQYFITLTLDGRKWQRNDLGAYKKAFMQWLRDLRKSYRTDIQALLVPERHKDGCWHMHGFVKGLPKDAVRVFPVGVPHFLIEHGYLNWPDYQKKFGFCSLAPIKDPTAAAFYVTKYISKDFAGECEDYRRHLYMVTRGCRHADKISDIYLHNSELSGICTEEYQFCKTGWAFDKSWSWPLTFDGADLYGELPLYPERMTDPLKDFDAQTLEPTYEQLRLCL